MLRPESRFRDAAAIYLAKITAWRAAADEEAMSEGRLRAYPAIHA